MKYKIYAGLGGGFGGATYQETGTFANKKDAMDYAYELAVQEYEQYDGLHGLRSVDMIMDEEGYSEEEAYDEWCQEMESWLDFYVKKVDEKK